MPHGCREHQEYVLLEAAEENIDDDFFQKVDVTLDNECNTMKMGLLDSFIQREPNLG